MQTNVLTAPETSVKPTGIIAGKFSGHLAAFQLNCFNECVAGGITRKSAHKIATDYASDLGRLMSSNPDVASKIGKAKTDGESSFKVTASTTKDNLVKQSNAMSLLRVMQVIGGLVKEKLIVSRKLPELTDDLQSYVDEAAEWSEKQVWAETK